MIFFVIKLIILIPLANLLLNATYKLFRNVFPPSIVNSLTYNNKILWGIDFSLSFPLSDINYNNWQLFLTIWFRTACSLISHTRGCAIIHLYIFGQYLRFCLIGLNVLKITMCEEGVIHWPCECSLVLQKSQTKGERCGSHGGS